MTQTTGDASPEITILMPCLNEAETLETCLKKAQGFLDQHGIRGELVVADNGSTDGSPEIARRCGARVVDVPLPGYGAALFYGTQAARGKYVIMGDSDGSYDFSNLMPFVEKLRAGYHLVMGNRFEGGIKPGAMPWKNRWVGTPFLSGIGRRFFRSPVRDFNCGLRGISREAFQQMDLRTTGMEYASEMIVKATLLEMSIAEVPTTLSPHGRSRPPHLQPWRDGWRHLRFMLLYSPRWLFLYPGILLMLAGLTCEGLLLWGPITVGGLSFDIDFLFYAAIAVLISYQTILFAIFSKIFAITEGLLPPDPRLDWFFRIFSLEGGLAAGAALILFGLGGALYGVTLWSRPAFGSLIPTHVMRIVIPAGLALTLGCQTILSSFLLSLLGMGRK
jgi:glycosyltransferase involved in cell wall biosynthesis